MQIKLLDIFYVSNIKGTTMNKAETVTLFNAMGLMAPAALIDKKVELRIQNNINQKK